MSWSAAELQSELKYRFESFFYDGGAKSLILATAAAAAQLFESSLVFPLCGFAAGFSLLTLAVHLKKEGPLYDFATKNPSVRRIALIAALVLCPVSPPLSFSAAFVSGALSGVSWISKQTRSKHAQH